MIGVVGKINISYSVNGIHYTETIDPQAVSLFRLLHCDSILFKIEEITYIEDTIYGAVVSMLEPQHSDNDFLVDGTTTPFSVEELGVEGVLSLSF